MAVIKSIGGIIPDVVIEETTEDVLEITKHPVQQGATISDHAFKKPVTLKMKCLWGEKSGDINITYQKILDLQSKRTLIDVITGKRNYKNMLIGSMSCTTDATTNTILSIQFSLEEIIIVNVVVTSVPARSRQRNAGKTGATENAGQKSAQTETRKVSALKTLAG